MSLDKKTLTIGIIGGLLVLATWTKGMACGGSADAMFIDGMIIHHYAAIKIAEQALQESSRPEITNLAKEIISIQKKELEQLQAWLKEWYPRIAPTGGMGVDMGSMRIEADAAKPFDLRFIEAMMPLQKGCITMANKALQKTQHEEIMSFATNIVTAQEAQTIQLKQWKKDWFEK